MFHFLTNFLILHRNWLVYGMTKINRKFVLQSLLCDSYTFEVVNVSLTGIYFRKFFLNFCVVCIQCLFMKGPIGKIV